jgi:hypothetical protein
MSEQKTATWVFHTISVLRRALHMDWGQFNGLVERYGLIAFLFKNCELLHYYDNDYIVNDTLRHIRQQGGDLNELTAVGGVALPRNS